LYEIQDNPKLATEVDLVGATPYPDGTVITVYRRSS
jgi:hypothetical protein